MTGKILLIIFILIFLPPKLLSEEDNPHKKMIDDQFICLDCHTKVPEKGENDPNYFLFDLPSENCYGCHDEFRHPGIMEHEEKKADPLPGDEEGNISCFTCHDPHPAGVIEGRTVYSSESSERTKKFTKLIIIPSLQEDIETSPDTKVYLKEEMDVYLRYPVGELCTKCHDNKEIYKSTWREHKLWDKYPGTFSR